MKSKIAIAIQMAADPSNESFLFIADMHSLTQIKEGETLRHNTYATAATWLAFGLDIDKTVFYRQSDVPQVAELAWYLSCFFPYQRLTLAHSFKDKANRLEDVNSGLFNYPMLMAADILLYDANIIPVGKDQMQQVQEETMYIPGTDGAKMSKSKGNLINLFQTDKKLRKQLMGIVSDSTPMEDPKDPTTDTTFALYKILGSQPQIEELSANYLAGNYGYGHAKQALYELILEKFGDARVFVLKWVTKAKLAFKRVYCSIPSKSTSKMSTAKGGISPPPAPFLP